MVTGCSKAIRADSSVHADCIRTVPAYIWSDYNYDNSFIQFRFFVTLFSTKINGYLNQGTLMFIVCKCCDLTLDSEFKCSKILKALGLIVGFCA